MLVKRSLGGIGSLYLDHALLGKVYYNFKPDQSPGVIICTLVFVGNNPELPAGKQRYWLWLEDGQYLLVTLEKQRAHSPSPYIGTSCDGVFHPTMSYAYTNSNSN